MDGKWIKDLHRLAGNYEGKVPEGLLDDIKQERNRRHSTPETADAATASSTAYCSGSSCGAGRRCRALGSTTPEGSARHCSDVENPVGLTNTRQRGLTAGEC